MAYECVMCPEGERARFVFMDTDTGETAASCEGHIFDFLMAMTAYSAQQLGVDIAEGEPTANGSEPPADPKAHRRSTKRATEPAEDTPEATETAPVASEQPEPAPVE